MRENLIGYLLGALDPSEDARIQARLEQDVNLREQLTLAEKSLETLKCDRDSVKPPDGLADRTCQFVFAFPRHLPGFRMHDADREYGAAGRSWFLADMFVAAGVFFAAALLFFPAVANSRHHARMLGCQDNLRQLGVALLRYSDRFGGYFPFVPAEGNLAVAGMYAPTLRSAGLIVDDHTVLCPGATDREALISFHIPTTAEVLETHGEALCVMQESMGGNFAYNLGYTSQGDRQLHAVRNLCRDYYVLMADPPERPLMGKRTNPNHGRAGQNLLMESGRVRNVSFPASGWNGDDPFVNRRGYVAAGVGADDAVVAPSCSPPLPALSAPLQKQ